MNLNLTPKLEQFIRDKANTGEYNNASEVAREAIRLLKEKDEQRALKIARLKEALKTGIDDAEQGNFADYSLESFVAEIDTKTNA